MSKTAVKKALAPLDAEALRELIMEMYAARREARDYLEFWADPDHDRELEAAKTKIQKLCFMSPDKPRRKPAFAELKTILKNFESLCPDPELTADILLFMPETILAWLKARHGIGMISNKPRLEKAISEAADHIESSALESVYGLRLQRLRDAFDDFYANQPANATRVRRWSRWRW